MADLRHLFKPINIAGVELKNRVFISPHNVQYARPDGTPSDRNLNYFVERAKNGVALIIADGSYFMKEGRTFRCQLGIYEDRLIPSWRRLSDAVHKAGARFGIQLLHPGRQGDPRYSGGTTEAPSAIKCPLMQSPVVEMSKERIREIVKAFGQGALRAKKAGLDLVELHGAHGFLISQFVSAYSNKRTDEYGGSLENRTRFTREIIEEIKQVCGMEFPVGIRISVEELVSEGMTIKDSQLYARKLEEWGVAYISACIGVFERQGLLLQISPMEIPLAPLEYLAAAIKEVVKIPVFAANSIADPILADQIIERGGADMVAMTRSHIADPEILKKAKEGRFDDIRNCVRCNHGCIDRVFCDLDVTCTVNAQVGREKELEIKPAKVTKKVVVIGGGPAGLEAARVAAMRGHNVILFEKETELGGLNRYAQLPPNREELGGVTRWQIMQLEKSGVDRRGGVEATVESVVKEKPDAVIVATGSSLHIPAIDGILGRDGRLRKNVRMISDVLTGRAEVGNKVLVIGANDIGLETAEFLKEQGKNVTVVDCKKAPSQEIIGGISWMNYLPRIEEKGIKLLLDKFVKEIRDDGVVLDTAGLMPPSHREGAIGNMEETVFETDTIVVGTGRRSVDRLFDGLIGKVGEVYKVGDAREPRHTYRAVKEGFEAGLNV